MGVFWNQVQMEPNKSVSMVEFCPLNNLYFHEISRSGQSQATQTWQMPQQLAAIASLDFRSTTATQRYVEKLSCNMKDNHCFSSSRPSTLYPGLSFHDLYSPTIVLAFSIFWAGRSIIRILTPKLWDFILTLTLKLRDFGTHLTFCSN